MPSDLTPVLRKVHDAWAKLKAARRAKVRADGAKSDAAGKYEQKVKEMAEAAVSLRPAPSAQFACNAFSRCSTRARYRVAC